MCGRCTAVLSTASTAKSAVLLLYRLYCCTDVLQSNAALVGHPMCSQGHIHTSNMLRGGVSMVVIMSYVVGNALEWFPHVGHLASLSRLLYCCTCCTAVLVHQVQQICCTSTAVQQPHIGQRLLYAVLTVLLYLLYCCTCCTAVLPGLR